MKPDFDYNSVPHDFVHCFNAQCEHASKCLRHQIALLTPPERGVVRTISPVFKLPAGTNCSYFKAEKLQRFALGFAHLLDKVPYKDAVVLRKQIFNYFERSTYYRCLHKERLIKVEEQAYICQLFTNRGIEKEPVFDEYVEQYEW